MRRQAFGGPLRKSVAHVGDSGSYPRAVGVVGQRVRAPSGGLEMAARGVEGAQATVVVGQVEVGDG
ncbi:hypothetical protein GCM10027089_61420 [Nocardia thraciensis]